MTNHNGHKAMMTDTNTEKKADDGILLMLLPLFSKGICTEMRPDKHSYYLNIADAVLERSTCLRRKYGAVIVKDDEIIATGYNGAPRGSENCCDIGYCERERQHIPHGENYEKCRSVHAEMNAIISAPRREMIGATLYLVGKEADGSPIYDARPCSMCERLIVNAGIKEVISRKEVLND